MEVGRLGGSRAGKDRHYILRFSVFAFMAFVRVRGTFVHRSCSPQICIIAPFDHFACRVPFQSPSWICERISCATFASLAVPASLRPSTYYGLRYGQFQ